MLDVKNYKTLFEKLLTYDVNGEIINELITQNILDLNDVTNFVISSNNFEYIYYLAKNVRCSDIEKLENKVIELGEIKNIYSFFYNVCGLTLEKFLDTIIEIKDAEYIYKFTKDFGDILLLEDLARLEDALIETNNAEYIYLFASDIKDVNIKKLEEAILKTDDTTYILKFAKNICCSDISKLTDKFLSLNDSYELEKFTIFMKGKMDENLFSKFADAFIKLGNFRCMSNFIVFNNPPLNIKKKIVDVIIESGNPIYIYEISKFVFYDDKDKDIERMLNAIIASGDPVWISEFYCSNASYIDDEKEKIIEDILVNSGDEKSLKNFYSYKKYSDNVRNKLLPETVAFKKKVKIIDKK